MAPIELTLTGYWEAKMRTAREKALRGNSKTAILPLNFIQKYVDCINATEFVYRGMFPKQLPMGTIREGQQISKEDLIQMGLGAIVLRWGGNVRTGTLYIH